MPYIFSIKRQSTAATTLLSLAVIIASCSTTRVEEEPFDWATSKTVRFVTSNFEYPKSIFTSGDTITIGYIRNLIILVDPPDITGNYYATITSASGDTESVNVHDIRFWSDLISIGFFSSGAKITSKASDEVIPENGVLEICEFMEPIEVTYQPIIYRIEFKGEVVIYRDKAVVVR